MALLLSAAIPLVYLAYRAYRAFGRDRLHADPQQVGRKIFLPAYQFQLRLVAEADTQQQAQRRLSQLAAAGKTIFYCSHVMDVVERICDRIIIIDDGVVVANGTFDELQAMDKELSLERIFTRLTGSSGHADKAREFISVFHEEPA